MKKKTCVVEIVFLLILAVIFAFGTVLERQQQEISNSMIRLHVKANSDSQQDQAVKLLVRDAVLAAAEPILIDVDSTAEAAVRLHENIYLLEDAANEALKSAGAQDVASVSLQRELFGTRYYDTFALPGGYFDALRVTIGQGEGKNWWCVVYPQICMTAASEPQDAVAAMAEITTDSMGVFQTESGEYTLKFRTLELFENIMGWFRTGGKGIPTSS